MVKKCVVLFLCLLAEPCIIRILAQETKPGYHMENVQSRGAGTIAESYEDFDSFLKFGLSGSVFAVRDDGTSPLIYRGPLAGIDLGYEHLSGKKIFFIDNAFQYGLLGTRNYPQLENNRANAFNNFLKTGWYKRFPGTINIHHLFYAGLQLGILSNFRQNLKFNNASLNFEIAATLGPSFRYHYRFTSEFFMLRSLMITASVTVPVISATLRPDYNIVGNFIAGNSQLDYKNTRFGSFNRFIGTNMQIQFYYYLKNKNAFRLGYDWDYYRFNSVINNVAGVSGNFTFSFLFRFNR